MNPMRNPVFRGAVLGGFLIALSVPAMALKIEKIGGAQARTLGGGSKGVEVVSGELFVQFSSTYSALQRTASLAAKGAAVIREMPSVGWTAVRIPAGWSVARALEEFKTLPGIISVAPNMFYRALRVPNDSVFWAQFHLDRINAPAAWDDEIGSTNKATIAVLDAGIEGGNTDLSSKLIGTGFYCDPGADKSIAGDDVACVAEPSGAPVAACNHATRVSGVAAASTNNNLGVAGVGWNTQLVSMRLFRTQDCTVDCSDASSGGCGTDDWAMVNAIDYIRTNLHNTASYGKVVINMSLGGVAACSGVLQTAVTNANTAGIVLIAAAGNDGSNVQSPGNCNNLMPVASTDRNGTVSSFSSHGVELTNNGVAANGEGIITTDVGNKVTNGATGTSFSAPIVAGVAALMLSANNGLTPLQVRTHIRSGATDSGTAGNDQYYGAGFVNACKAVKLALGQATTSCASSSGVAGFAAADDVISFPNPFRPGETTMASIKIPTELQGSGTTVKIYTIDGQFVRELTPYLTVGLWDGKNDSGNWVASGTYIVRVGNANKSKRGRLAVLR
ncbi:MAG: S8 family peptidase [Elusimicrobiota bacterium]|jgi:subtilisin family serine protease